MRLSISKTTSWASSQVTVQAISAVAYTSIIYVRGIEFFGLYSVCQATASILAILIGYRQDINVLLAKDLFSSNMGLGQAYMTSLMIAFPILFGSLLFDDATKIFSYASLVLSGLSLALLELNAAALLKADKYLIWISTRVSLPILAALASAIESSLQPPFIVLISCLASFFTSFLALLGKPEFSSFFYGGNNVSIILKKNLFPTLNGLIFILTINLPLFFAQEKFDESITGITAALMRFVGGPTIAISSAISAFLLKENLIRHLAEIAVKRRSCSRVIWAALIVIFLSYVVLRDSFVLAIIFLTLAIVLSSILGSSQSLIQAIGISGRLTIALIAQGPLYFYFYFLSDKLEFLLFTSIYLSTFLLTISFLILNPKK